MCVARLRFAMKVNKCRMLLWILFVNYCYRKSSISFKVLLRQVLKYYAQLELSVLAKRNLYKTAKKLRSCIIQSCRCSRNVAKHNSFRFKRKRKKNGTNLCKLPLIRCSSQFKVSAIGRQDDISPTFCLGDRSILCGGAQLPNINYKISEISEKNNFKNLCILTLNQFVST